MVAPFGHADSNCLSKIYIYKIQPAEEPTKPPSSRRQTPLFAAGVVACDADAAAADNNKCVCVCVRIHTHTHSFLNNNNAGKYPLSRGQLENKKRRRDCAG